MQVVKNFGFTRPFIKTMQPGNYLRFSDDYDDGSAMPNAARPMARRDLGRPARIPKSALSLDAFRDWCQSMKSSFEESGEPAETSYRSRWRNFEEARAFARSLGLKSGADWRRFSKGDFTHLGERPDDIPGCPERIYRDAGWAGYRDWLGVV